MHHQWMRTGTVALCALATSAATAAAPPADTVYRNGYVYTVDAKSSVRQALAVQGGRIVYVGDERGAQALIGKATKLVDLQGRMLMPGLVDGHMHPVSGGARRLSCNLEYASLTVPQFQARIQDCLDKDEVAGQDAWLEVVNWFQQSMKPDGVETTSATLDVLHTRRPVVVRSSFGHSSLVNSRALELAGIDAGTADPLAGKIVRNAQGKATGLLEDSAQELVARLVPPLSPAKRLAAATAALDALRRQGVTSFLDAAADRDSISAFAELQKQGKLTARAHFAVEIPPEQGGAPVKAVADLLNLARQYDQGRIKPAPTLQVRHAKLFMDGVIAAPALSGTMLEPYYVNKGSEHQPHWAPGTSKGPDTYFPPPVLKRLLLELARAGIDPHIHVDGDGAVREALDAIAYLRTTTAGKRARPALAHDEIVDPADFHRFAKLNTTAVLSLQWGKPAADTVGMLKPYMGPKRYDLVEPQSLLQDAGARIAYGSDWPVDALNQWFALKVGVTRTAAPDAGPEYAGTLGRHPGLSRASVLRAITSNSSYTLRQEAATGSLEVGKMADLIVLDRNFFQIPAEEIAEIKVLLTVVGGRVVYDADSEKETVK